MYEWDHRSVFQTKLQFDYVVIKTKLISKYHLHSFPVITVILVSVTLM